MADTRERQMKKATYDYCKAKGICVICRKEPAFYNHVRCPACIEKQANRQAQRLATMTEEQRAHRNQVKRERYHRNKAAGLCVNCGKKSQDGKVLCARCDIQAKRNAADYRIRSGRTKGWADAGRCIWCGGERVEGKQMCPDCLERNRALMANARRFAPRDRPWERWD